jgi:hypothetical protein
VASFSFKRAISSCLPAILVGPYKDSAQDYKKKLKITPQTFDKIVSSHHHYAEIQEKAFSNF